jgi:hypothetical protein
MCFALLALATRKEWRMFVFVILKFLGAIYTAVFTRFLAKKRKMEPNFVTILDGATAVMLAICLFGDGILVTTLRHVSPVVRR